jgi:RHS repeat-associated protein
VHGNLSEVIFGDGRKEYRMPDAVGNLFETADRKDRKYSKGGKLLKSKHGEYKYDAEGNLIEKITAKGSFYYIWNEAGMLQKVIRPDKEEVSFGYDALGRRLWKKFKKTITNWVWDGNVPLHEWKTFDAKEAVVDDMITWIFEENSFVPVGKIKGNKTYSIATDHLGTPYQMFSDEGTKFWECELDGYGKPKMLVGENGSCPFRYQGQYEDVETGLYYNRLRYYDSEIGAYISQDPIGLEGGFSPYNYVHDPNKFIDVFGLSSRCAHLDKLAKEAWDTLPDGKGKNMTTVAVGVDKNGNLYVSTSKPYTPRQIKDWAKENNATVVNSKKENVHAEEAVHNNSQPDIVQMGSSKPICKDCENGMNKNNIEYNSDNTSGEQSPKRKREPENGTGDW